MRSLPSWSRRLLRHISGGYSASTYSFEGYEIPIDLIDLTGAGPESFNSITTHHLQCLKQTVGLNPDHFVLEIGCGIGRDAIQLTKILSLKGRYVGVDIVKRSIDWCMSNISSRFPNFSFLHYDVKDQLHNPGGTTATQAIRLPIPDESVDRIILWSVFTHMFRHDILHYLSEFKRLLAPGGSVFATCFVVDDAIIASAQKNDLTPYALRFEHLQEPGCYINSLEHPLGAVAYTEQALQEMITKAGLYRRALERGNWSGHFTGPAKDAQDVIILSRAPT
jgi:ubiquinone/menaquinone biosynthesis C-methylase UbiE